VKRSPAEFRNRVFLLVKRVGASDVQRLLVGMSSFNFLLGAVLIATGGLVSPYDTGVYLEAGIHVVAGQIPYRDFFFLQPPGIIYLSSFLAGIAKVIGHIDLVTAARSLCLLSASLNVYLAGYIVRGRGKLAVLIASFLTMISMANLETSTGFKLEPFYTTFLLAGLSLYFSDKPLGASKSRERLMGILFGLAIVFKFWALLPICVFLVTCRRGLSSSYRTVVGFAAATTLFMLSPFLVLAPGKFLRQTLYLQLNRTSFQPVGVLTRLGEMSFFQASNGLANLCLTSFWYLILVLSILSLISSLKRRELNSFLLASSASSLIVVLTTPEFFSYYSYLSLPFVAMLVGVAMPRVENSNLFRRVWAKKRAACLVTYTLLATMVLNAWGFAYGQAHQVNDVPSKLIQIASKHGCVATTSEWVLLDVRSLQIPKTLCGEVVDPSGSWIVYKSSPANPSTALIKWWKDLLSSSNVVILSNQEVGAIPWWQPEKSPLILWFNKHFRLEYQAHGLFVYWQVPS